MQAHRFFKQAKQRCPSLDTETSLGRAVKPHLSYDTGRPCCPSCAFILTIEPSLPQTHHLPASFHSPYMCMHARSLGSCFHSLIGDVKIMPPPSWARCADLWLGARQAHGRRGRLVQLTVPPLVARAKSCGSLRRGVPWQSNGRDRNVG